MRRAVFSFAKTPVFMRFFRRLKSAIGEKSVLAFARNIHSRIRKVLPFKGKFLVNFYEKSKKNIKTNAKKVAIGLSLW